MKKYKERVELHCQSNYSMRYGLASPFDILKYASEFQMSAIAVTDCGSIMNFPQMEDIAKYGEHTARPIYGMEAYIVNDIECSNKCNSEYESCIKAFPFFHATILVQNEYGKQNLYKLVSESELKYKCDQPRIPLSRLLKMREGLLLGSGCNCSLLYKEAFMKTDEAKLIKIISIFDYIEIMPTDILQNIFKSDQYSVEELQKINKSLIMLSEKSGKLVIATGNTHYLKKTDQLSRNILRHMAGCEYDDYTKLHLRTTAEMMSCFNYLGDNKAYEIVVQNTNLIAEKCLLNEIIPKKNLYPVISGASERIRNMCEKAIGAKYAVESQNKVKKRLDWELSVIEKIGMTSQFLQCKEIMNKMGLTACDIFVSGQTGYSIIAYLLELTDIDPLRYKLSPEFLFGINDDREFDISIIDFPSSVMEELQGVINTLEGVHSVCCARTIFTISPEKASLAIEFYSDKNKLSFNERQKNLILKSISGVMDNYGIHDGSFIFIPKNINDIMDIMPLAVSGDGKVTTYFESCYLDNILYIMDLTSCNMLEMLRRLSIKVNMNLSDIPYDDETVYELFNLKNNTDILNICKNLPFSYNDYLMTLIKKIKPKTFNDMVRLFGFFHGIGPWEDFSKLNNMEIEKSDNVFSSRDDIFDKCLNAGISRNKSFQIAEAVRKGKAVSGNYSNWKDMRKTMLDAGININIINLCEETKYLIRRSHAIYYAQMYVRATWFKVHFPEEYEHIWQELYKM